MSILVKSARVTLQYVRTDLQGGLSMMFQRMNPLKDLTGPFQLSDLSKDSFHEKTEVKRSSYMKFFHLWYLLSMHLQTVLQLVIIH